MSPTEPNPSSGAQTLETWAQIRDAWLDLLTATRRELIVAVNDLGRLHPDHPETTERLRQCLRRLYPGQVKLLVRTPESLLTRMPRTRQLLVDYGHIATVRVMASHHADDFDRGLILSDQAHCLVQPQYDAPRAYLYQDDPAVAARERPQLETIWGAATEASIGAVLGL
ncbi:hypothetical protein G3580_10870 [Nitrogeniibacter mangrovi]|uniref:DUF7931 domain-containing protein n=1 Tax=Nitrogeniibacter mangrovi TaxID=2016596 RepID=A0A6C1B383_9RHOO|nr:hypothetical protein [Nitrogeniibacter mangrovi]QID18096.1 hypothetical protein G3580_10870 [Nitrogeniibacter mangrovi]